MKENVTQQPIDPRSFIDIAKAQDADYARVCMEGDSGSKLNETALRVEQGEYVIAEISQSIGIAPKAIGTYNLQQCVGIYLNDGEKHGLAHIDGHTEISSLNEFCNNF